MIGERHDMTDAEWAILQPALPTGRQGPERKTDRQVMNGIFFVLRTGTPWRDLPERYGPYTTCYNRYNRWSRDGTWLQILERLQEITDRVDDDDGEAAHSLKTRMIDSSAVRAHRHAAGGRKDDEEPAQLGRSRGGFGTKIHAVVDGKGQPRILGLSPGNAADCTQAETLLAEIEAGMTVIADKAYDTNAILRQVAEAGATAVIPSKSNRTEQRPLDREADASHNLVERFFGRVKEFRRVATRYDKRARNFLSAVILAATRYLLRGLANALF